MTPETPVIVRNSTEIIAVIPFVLGYHPADSIVVVGLAGPRIAFAACYELPPPDGDFDEAARAVAAAVPGQGTLLHAVIGFGPPDRVTPAVLRLFRSLGMAGLRVYEAIRVTDGRWWSYFCEDLTCCPGDGRPCQPKDGVIAAEATYRGQVALPSRRDLIAQVASLEGAERTLMREATARARQRFAALVVDDIGVRRAARRVRQAGQIAIRKAESRYRAGHRLDEDETAWLGALLVDRSVENYALNRTATDDWRIRLWTDVLRRVERVYVPAPAGLLAVTAWRAGNGPLARVAVDRALAVDPHHELAGLLHQILGFGLSPHMVSHRVRTRGRTR
jgi:hypothetical protein